MPANIQLNQMPFDIEARVILLTPSDQNDYISEWVD